MTARTRRAIAALVGCCLGTTPLLGQEAATGVAAGASIESAAWLAGCWRMDAGRHAMDEQWMMPAGGAMLGMNRSLRYGEFRGWELLILKPREGRLIYEAHPSGQAPTEFASTLVSDTVLAFENPTHDFPQRIIYQRTAPDSILAIVYGEVGDAQPAFKVPFGRIPCTGTTVPSPGEPAAMELLGAANFITAHPAMPGEGLANAVIEIPAGTSAKWEVVEPGSRMAWEIEDGVPRVIQYLAYPANYGMIPRTMLPKDMGGDGDPLDVIVLGPALTRGSVLPVRPVAVLHLLDDGERDDKILAVRTTGPLSEVTTFDELDRAYPGLADIVRIWFTSYKGPGRLESSGYGDEEAARAVIEEASAMFEAAQGDGKAERDAAGN